MENSTEANQLSPQIRVLKIGYQVRTYPYSFINNFRTIVPSITISGNWFHKAGFLPLSRMKLEIFDKKIILTLLE